MATATMMVRVRLVRVWPLVWWLRLAARLLPLGLTPERTVAVGNALLGLARVRTSPEGSRRWHSQPLRGRLVLDRGEVAMIGWPDED